MPSASAISVSVSAHRSSSPYQSALRRANRETSIPSTIPTRPSPTSATSRWKPSRPVGALARAAQIAVDDDDLARAQPSATARSASSYWRSPLSVLRSTCAIVDWRTYTYAAALQVPTVRPRSSLLLPAVAHDARDHPASSRRIRSCAAGANDSHLPPIRSPAVQRQGKLTRRRLKPAHEGSPPRVVGASREASLRAAAVAADRDSRCQQPPQPAHAVGRQQRARRRLAPRHARARRLDLDRARRAIRQPHDQTRRSADPPAALDHQPLAAQRMLPPR